MYRIGGSIGFNQARDRAQMLRCAKRGRDQDCHLSATFHASSCGGRSDVGVAVSGRDD